MKLYRLKLNNKKNTYMSAGSVTFTKDKYLALTSSKELVERNLGIIDGQGTIEIVEIKDPKSCKVGTLYFNPDDSYRLSSERGLIIHETKKFVYTMSFNPWTMSYCNVQKHKREHENTQDIRTGQGFKRG